MSFTRLAVSLEQYEIGLSGAVPERDEWSEPAMDRGILEFVSNFSGLVLKYGGRIVHGCHPTFTPIILRQAREHAGARSRKPVTLVMSELWARNLKDEDFKSMTDVAEFIVTKKVGEGDPKDVESRNQSLTVMRRVLVHSQNVMVAVGGKMHGRDGQIPGLAEEMSLAAERGIPRFLVAGLGGFASKLAEDLSPDLLKNDLTHEQNMGLLQSKDVGACVSLLFHHMAQSKSLAGPTTQPVNWNPDALLDHRDRALRNWLEQYIVAVIS